MEIKLLDMTNQLFISEYNSRVEYSDQFAFVEQCETMKAPGQERARPFGGALCPGAFLFVVRRFTPSAAEPDSPAGDWSCS